MAIQSVSNVSFGATTKKGNEYKKTHAGTITGTAVGAGLGTLGAAKALKNLKTMAGKRKFVKDSIELTNKLFGNKTGEAIHYVKGSIAKGIKPGIAFGVTLQALIGLGIGALINKAINHSKAAKADKAAETQKAK